MRLLERNEAGNIRLTRDFLDHEIPTYAILSHTWGSEEVVFKDLTDAFTAVPDGIDRKLGYDKIGFCGDQAWRDGLHHFWVDTCCIDKTNNVELQEAIISMFRWYRNAVRCYVYLADVSKPALDDKDSETSRSRWKPAFRKSRWFARGWTLQELIAPTSVEFFSKEGVMLGSKSSLEETIHEITGIPVQALRGNPLSSFSVSERMAWIEGRATTREEDTAYSLFGIFDIQMPLLYGERKEKAFERLRNEIEVQDKRSTILSWLAQIDYAPQQSDFINRRQAGTGEWLLHSEQYQAWLATNGQTLFCPGIPGAGKTILASVVVDDLNTRFHRDDTIGLAYVYCNFRRQEEQKKGRLLANLLKQLARRQPALPESVKALYRQHKNDRTQPSSNDIQRTFQSVITGYPRVFIVVDALDECQASDGCRKGFLSELFNVQNRHGVNLLVTSRLIPEIIDQFKGCIHLEIRATREDVERYIDGHLDQLITSVRQDQQLQHEIKTGISKAVDGMFLLAQIYLGSLEDKTTKKKLKSAVQGFQKQNPAPREDAKVQLLAHAYEQAMERIYGQKQGWKALAEQVLGWIICAKRPLTTAELQHALAVEVGKPVLDEDNLPQIEDMVKACAGLVTVDEESGIIRLVHYTAQEYFERTQMRWFPSANENITTTCATYLSFTAFQTGCCLTDVELRKRLQLYPLFEYAAHSWSYHAGQVPWVIQQIVDFLENTRAVEASIQATEINPHHPWDLEFSPTKMTGLHLTAYLGLVKETFTLLGRENDPNARDSLGRTPLSWAAENGHQAAIETLLAVKGVDLNPRDSRGMTPLLLAVNNGREKAVKLLLAKTGVNPNSRNSDGQTSLLLAAQNGSQNIVNSLLEVEGIDLNAKDSDELGPIPSVTSYFEEYRKHMMADKLTPLLWAVMNGHEAVTKLLLAKDGVDLNSKDRYGFCALSKAIEKGNEAAVRLLLEKDGVDLNSKSDTGQTPLTVAVRYGHEAIVELLLTKQGINPDTRDSFKTTPLSLAASTGRKRMVELLLNHGVSPNSANSGGITPLSLAAMNGHERVVELLLGQDGINPDPRDALSVGYSWSSSPTQSQKFTPLFKEVWGRTPLSYAAEKGHKKVVELLLADHRVDPNSKDSSGQTPLLLAAKQGHENVVRLFLDDNRIDRNSECRWNPTSLLALPNNNENSDALSREGLRQVKEDEWVLAMKKLIWKAMSNNGRTPLSYSAENGHEAVVKLLLGAEQVDVDSRDDAGRTPLSWAARNGQEAIVELLLQTERVDPNKQDHFGRTPLSHAAEGRQEEAAKAEAHSSNVRQGGNHAVRAFGALVSRQPASNPALGYLAVIRTLLNNGADIDSKDLSSWTPLFWAVANGCEASVHCLLEHGANIDILDHLNRSPLGLAARNGQRSITETLIGKGVNPHSRDRYGLIPLSIAAAHGHVGVFQVLLDIDNVDFGIQDRFGRSLLWWAKRGGNEVTQLLLQKVVQSNVTLSDTCTPEEDQRKRSASTGKTSGWCDACTLDIPEDCVYYNCAVCNGGDLIICSTCFKLGAFCLEDGHMLVERCGE